MNMQPPRFLPGHHRHTATMPVLRLLILFVATLNGRHGSATCAACGCLLLGCWLAGQSRVGARVGSLC